MVDNIEITPGTGSTVAADDIAGVLHQRVKISIGADGSASDAVGGAGAVSAAVQRTTLASDDPAVVSLAILDDWDESDRCKVNLIDGQAGVTAGAGAVAASTPRVTLASDDPAVVAIGTTNTRLTTLTGTLSGEYETVAASQTAQTLGATGGTGDYVAGVLVIPATTSPGNVILLDNATSITIFTGGTSSVSNLVPFYIPLGMYSVSGAWKITTGANVSCIGVGNFT